jgi:hypothetical protein
MPYNPVVMITIIAYGAGNVGSIKNTLRKLGHKSLITSAAAFQDILKRKRCSCDAPELIELFYDRFR